MKVFMSYIKSLLLLAAISVLTTGAAAKPVENQPASYVPPKPDEIARVQAKVASLPVGERIAFWAESFVGAPYDTDPLGAYVRHEEVVCDTYVDCMYHVFRSVELATSSTPEEAIERALYLRFKTQGVVMHGKVMNYSDRFDYAEDMIFSGKWGEDVTAKLGDVKEVAGSRGRDRVTYLPNDELLKPGSYERLKSGDLIFFIKDPARRVAGEIVGHLGIAKMEEGMPYLIHASGTKSREGHTGGGVVKKVDLLEYLSETKFIGVVVTRFSH
jgi:hypothetical protein